MSKNVKVVHDIQGINQLMKSEWFQEVLEEVGQSVIGRSSGMGVEAEMRTHLGSFTAITNIYPADEESAKTNWENRTLTKALGGG